MGFMASTPMFLLLQNGKHLGLEAVEVMIHHVEGHLHCVASELMSGRQGPASSNEYRDSCAR